METYDWASGLAFGAITTIPAIVVLMIFINRYVFGGLTSQIRLWRDGDVVNTEQGTVTVLIPCYNEGRSVYDTIASLRRQSYPRDKVFIHVIDDASGPATREALADAIRDFDIQVTFRDKNRGKRANLIDATRSAMTDFILSVDSDCLLAPNAIQRLVETMSDDVDAVGGVVRVSNSEENWLAELQSVKYFVGYEYLKGLENHFRKVMCLSGCITLYRRGALLAVEEKLLTRNFLGGDVRYGEDRFLTRQIVMAGGRTRMAYDAYCFTKAPATLPSWFQQQLRWRRSNIVDFLSGVWTIWKVPMPVALHYSGLGAMLFVFPPAIFHSILSGNIAMPMLFQIGFCGLLGLQYATRVVFRPEDKVPRAGLLSFLLLPSLLMVSYLTITPLALLTLITTRWETRSSENTQRPDLVLEGTPGSSSSSS